jgi:hypothetical protein
MDVAEVDDRGYIYGRDRAGSGITILQLTGDALKVVTRPNKPIVENQNRVAVGGRALPIHDVVLLQQLLRKRGATRVTVADEAGLPSMGLDTMTSSAP